MTNLRRDRACVGLILILLFFLSQHVQAIDAEWTRILTGAITAGPVVRGGRVFCATDDRSLTCLSESGQFLWSRVLKGRAAARLIVTPSGVLVAFTSNGMIEAYNLDGRFLYRLSGGAIPVADPLIGFDGRIFVPYQRSVACISETGTVKWTLPLNEPTNGPVGFTGDGDFLVSLVSGLILRISPYGEILERIPAGTDTVSLSPVPSGFILGHRNGSAVYYFVYPGELSQGNASAALWSRTGSTPLEAALYDSGSIVLVSRNGHIEGVNATDGALLWAVSLPPFIVPLTCDFSYDQFTIAAGNQAVSLTLKGALLYSIEYPRYPGTVAVAESGRVYCSGAQWALRAYKPETRIQGEKKTANTHKYGILEEISPEWDLAYVTEQLSPEAFFTEVSRRIASGTVGYDEVVFARRLRHILTNDGRAALVPYSFEPHERGRAASLLASLSSREYREALIDASLGPLDESLAIGLLSGLSLLGPDDGAGLDAVERILSTAGGRSLAVQRSVCQALYAIVRYSSGEIAERGLRSLAGMSQAPYDSAVQDAARAMLASLFN